MLVLFAILEGTAFSTVTKIHSRDIGLASTVFLNIDQLLGRLQVEARLPCFSSDGQQMVGIQCSRESGELMFSAVSGRLFTIASASHINVLSVSSLSCVPFYTTIADRILRTVLICRSQRHPSFTYHRPK